MPCFVNQALRALPAVDSSLHETILRETLKVMSDIDFTKSPPEMARVIFDIIESHAGPVDLYEEAKKNSNQYILAMYDELKEMAENSDDPFRAAARLAVAGNIIDFGAKHDFSDEAIHEELDKVLHAEFAEDATCELRSEIESADTILYIGDNAGEIVFDKLFISYLPAEKITYAVRGTPIINDALMEDAETAGLTKLVKVISNGAGIPGTVLAVCSDEFRQVFHKADLVISKGQGNYETLNDSDKNIFFLLKIKCDIVARDLGHKVGDFVIRKSSSNAG